MILTCGRAKRFGALRARANRTQVIVAIDARRVAVVEADLDGIVADLSGGCRAELRFEHG